jgi:putative toxin-antitoxin system antitoxin component (TIGR02293 family)
LFDNHMVSIMSEAVIEVRSARPPTPFVAPRPAADPREFWRSRGRAAPAGGKTSRRAFDELVDKVIASPGVHLFDAVEVGVPTALVDVIAGATGQTAAAVMEMIGVSPTTFRRKEEAGEPLPDVAGHRVMGFLRVVATLRRLLAESGDAEQLRDFDLVAWVAPWMAQPLPEFVGKTPAQMLRNPEGMRAIEQQLERMRGGLPA